MDEREKKKQAAEKAKTEALKRLAERNKQKEQASEEAEDKSVKALQNKTPEELAKVKAAAAAKAKATALAKQKQRKTAETEATELQPTPNQPLLDEYVKKIEEVLGKEVLEEASINRLSKNVPTLVVKKEYYFKMAEFLKKHFSFDYLSELHGTDFVTHMEVYVYLYSHLNNQSIVLKTKIDCDQSSIPSLVPLWEGANWPECETYDLLGIRFENHPDLRRILLGEDWVGHPLRKDYEPFDVEV